MKEKTILFVRLSNINGRERIKLGFSLKNKGRIGLVCGNINRKELTKLVLVVLEWNTYMNYSPKGYYFILFSMVALQMLSRTICA